jgi:hypothetical protein
MTEPEVAMSGRAGSEWRILPRSPVSPGANMSRTFVTPLAGANYNDRATCTDYANFATVMTISWEDGKNAHKTCKSDHLRAAKGHGERIVVEKCTNAADRNPLCGVEISCVGFAKRVAGIDLGKVLALDPLAPSRRPP